MWSQFHFTLPGMPRTCMYFIYTYPLRMTAILAHIKMQYCQLPEWMMPSCCAPSVRFKQVIRLAKRRRCPNHHLLAPGMIPYNIQEPQHKVPWTLKTSKQQTWGAAGKSRSQLSTISPSARWLQEALGIQDVIPRVSQKEEDLFVANFTSSD